MRSGDQFLLWGPHTMGRKPLRLSPHSNQDFSSFKKKSVKEMEETILKGKAVRRARLPGATSTVKCPLISA